MRFEEAISNRSITTTISIPLSLYTQLLAKAQAENISLSEAVRRALFKEFEIKEELEGLGKSK